MNVEQKCLTGVLRRFSLLLILSWFGSAQLGWAQDPKQELSASLVGKQMVLRTFSAEPEVRCRWADGSMMCDPATWLTFGIVTPEKVSYGRDRVTITGVRQTAALDQDNHMLVAAPQRRPVRVVVDMGGTDFAQILPKLRLALFFDTFRLAAEAVPAGLQERIPLHRSKLATPGAGCGRCLPVSDQGQWKETALDEVTPPRLIHATEPTYSSEARANRVSGTVLCGIIVAASGKVNAAWLLWPLGSGLDESASEAVRQYVFEPAKKDGVPVASYVRVEVHFEMR